MGDLREEEVMKDMTPKLVGEPWLKYPTERSKCRHSYGVFECQYCGKHFAVALYLVKNKNNKSCGCLRTKHGLESNKFYNTWYMMVARCNNPENKNYKNYGARGITVCEEWLDVANFVAWAESTHPNIEGVTLDRIDNDKGYSPENCRWADKITQNINQRVKNTNKSGFVGISWNKKTLTWRASITLARVRVSIGSFKTLEEAVLARDNYIIENKLPHKLSTGYAKDTQNEQL